MKIIFIIIGIIGLFYLIKGRPENKLSVLLLSLIFIPISVKFFDAPLDFSLVRFFNYVLLFSLLIENKISATSVKRFPLFKSFLVLLGCLIVVGLTDERLNIFLKIARPTKYFIENYFLTIMAFMCIKEEKHVFKVLNVLIGASIVVTCYGLYNYIILKNPYQDVISKTYDVHNISDEYIWRGDRTRISSFFYHPMLYGLYLSIIGLMLFLEMIEKRTIFKKVPRFLIVALLMVVILNLLLVNSRTAQLSFLLGLFLFLSGYFSYQKKVSKLMLVVAVFFAAIQIPIFTQTGERLLDIIYSGGTSVQGSSLEMRQIQLFESYMIFQKSPATGNGLRYINENLGWEDRKYGRIDTGGLGGFESFLFELLIEQGIVGLAGHLLLFITLAVFHLKNMIRIKDKKAKCFILMHLSLIAGYMLFIFGTGELNSMPLFFILMGISVKYQTLRLNPHTQVKTALP